MYRLINRKRDLKHKRRINRDSNKRIRQNCVRSCVIIGLIIAVSCICIYSA